MKKFKIKLTKKARRNITLISAIAFTILLIAFVTYRILSGNDSKKTSAKITKNNNIYQNTFYTNAVVEIKQNEIVNEIDENVVVEVEQTTTKDGKTKVDSDMPYYIKINTLANVVTIYTKDSDGDYTIPVKAMVCSTGEYTPPVPSYPKSMYKTTGYRAVWNGLQGDVYGQYATQIVGNILFHSVPYTAESPDALEWWEYDKLGTSASLGCVRLTVADAQWIFYNIESGTVVEFYEDSNPGPLGKPSAQPISGNVECRGWDPTDPEDGNPWRNPKQEESKQEPKQENKQENKTQNSVINETNNNTINEIENQVNTINETNTNSQNMTINETNTNSQNTTINETNTENTNSQNEQESIQNTINTQEQNIIITNETNDTNANAI